MTKNPLNNNNLKEAAEVPPLLVLSWLLSVYNKGP